MVVIKRVDCNKLKGLQGLVAILPVMLTCILCIPNCFFSFQWVFGFVSYLFPKTSFGLRSMYMPHHVFWGLAIFGLACCSALTGIMEKAIFLFKGGEL